MWWKMDGGRKRYLVFGRKWYRQKIFANERLTKFKRILFVKTRIICREKQYKYVWTNNAEVLVRKEDGSKIIKMIPELDINKLQV